MTTRVRNAPSSLQCHLEQTITTMEKVDPQKTVATGQTKGEVGVQINGMTKINTNKEPEHTGIGTKRMAHRAPTYPFVKQSTRLQ